jgi:hypothetical protein
MAPKIAYDPSKDSLLTPAKNAVFFQSWTPEDFTRDDHGLLCAEMSRLAYAPPNVIRDVLDGIEFTVYRRIGGEDLEERTESLGTDGFVAHSPQRNLTVLAFRGTESAKPEDLLLDGATLQQASSRGFLVHRGFAAGWDSVRDRTTHLLDPRRGKLLVTGHSLGAAIATLAAIETKPDALITFGSPLVGNDKLGALLASKTKLCRRYVNCCDLITRVPPEQADREHVGQLLSELTPVDRLGPLGSLVKGTLGTTTSLVSSVLHVAHLDPHFQHICPAHYADRTGKLRPGISAEDRQKDQDAARKAYRRTPGSAALRDLADHAPINYVSIFTGRT